jgi:hypothetical protein
LLVKFVSLLLARTWAVACYSIYILLLFILLHFHVE